MKRLKPKRKRVFYPRDQEKFKEALKILHSEDQKTVLKTNPEILEIMGSNNIVFINNRYGIVPKDESNKDIIATLKDLKKGRTTQEISVVPARDFENYVDYRHSPKYIEAEIKKIFDSLNTSMESLIGLAIYIEECFNKNKRDKAEKVRMSVRERYGSEGLKIVNLWTQGYLKSLFKFLSTNEDIPSEINARITEFIKNSDSIIFVHTQSNQKEIMNQVRGLLKMNKDYVAVHGLGAGGIIAFKAVHDLKVAIPSDYEIVEISIRREWEQEL